MKHPLCNTRNYCPFNLRTTIIIIQDLSFFLATITLWSHLPNLTKDSDSLQVFKSIINFIVIIIFDLSVRKLY